MAKGDVTLFHFKVMDFYQKQILKASQEKWWPLLHFGSILRRTSRTQIGARTNECALTPWKLADRP